MTFNVEVRRQPEEWEELLDDLGGLALQVFLAAMRTEDDAAVFARRLDELAVWVYEQTLTAEAARFGHYAQASLLDQDVLELIEEETAQSAFGVIHTYNYELAKEIAHIGEEREEEKADLYALLLFGVGGWWWTRRQWKDVQIGTWETWRRINQALGDFYDRNELPISEAMVLPHGAVCAICQALVAGNPYPPEQVTWLCGQLPAHVNCPHYVHTIVAGKAKGILWLGG